MTMKRIGVVGARGHVGQELLSLVAAHGQLELDFVVSREWAGQEVVVGDDRPFGRLRYENLNPDAICRREVDAIVLALPNGRADDYVVALDAAGTALLARITRRSCQQLALAVGDTVFAQVKGVALVD
mgnify:CR=1 FL=1